MKLVAAQKKKRSLSHQFVSVGDKLQNHIGREEEQAVLIVDIYIGGRREKGPEGGRKGY